MQEFRLRVLSYNIHKGFSATNSKYVLQRLKASIEEVGADLVLLQEVIGHHDDHRSHMHDWKTTAQFEYLADKVWTHFAYGRNAVYDEGHHGNAILSKFPITFWENQDVSLSSIERRGLLHATIQVPELAVPLQAFCVHMGLFEKDRREQTRRLCERIQKMAPPGAPVIVGGDFNDWRQNLTPQMREQVGLEEAFLKTGGRHARTFPSILPLLPLDRLYYRKLVCAGAVLLQGGVWRELSDHLPILVDLHYSHNK